MNEKEGTVRVSDDCSFLRHKHYIDEGILRDFFAGMALFRLAGFPGADEMKRTISKKAYEWADAMLEARKG